MARPPSPGCPDDCPDEGHCHARKRQVAEGEDGPGLCSLRKGYGTDHKGIGNCKYHGGATANGRRASQRFKAEEAVVTYGLSRRIDPWVALLGELWRTQGHVNWLAERVAELEADELVTGDRWTEERSGFQSGTTTKVGAGKHALLMLYQEERKHLSAVAKDCIACGIAERQVRIAQEQGHMFAEMMRAILADLGVQRNAEVDRVVHRHLSAVA